MSKPTHYVLSRSSGKNLWLYNVKTHEVYELDGEYCTTMGPGFTEKVLDNTNPSYLFKRIITQLENK